MTPRDDSTARSITYYRAIALTALTCGVGSAIVGVLALSSAAGSRINAGVALTLLVLALVMVAFCVACLQIVAQLHARSSPRARARGNRSQPPNP